MTFTAQTKQSLVRFRQNTKISYFDRSVNIFNTAGTFVSPVLLIKDAIFVVQFVCKIQISHHKKEIKTQQKG